MLDKETGDMNYKAPFERWWAEHYYGAGPQELAIKELLFRAYQAGFDEAIKITLEDRLDQTKFELTKEQWEKFQAFLDTPSSVSDNQHVKAVEQ